MKGTICIDGVVGVGKSSLAELLTKDYNIVFYEEPVVNNPILDKFYYDKKRWSFPLQIFFLNERFKHIKEAAKINRCVMDRSIYGDVIFAKMLNDSGDMTDEEFHLYENLLSNMLEHVEKPTLMIYLKSNVDGAIKKIKNRGRDYEQVVERKYWEDLNRNYESYFNNYNLSPILVIDVNKLDFVNNEDDKKYVLDIIKNKMLELNMIGE